MTMATNINVELFKRYAPKKKLEIIEKLSNDELLAVSESTVKKIIQEVGQRRYKSRDKELRIDYDRRVGNNWNSVFEAVGTYKKKLYVHLYVQFGDCETDTTEVVDYAKFFCRGKYEGEIKGIDYHFNPKYYYYTYDEEEKAKCIRSILLQYLYSKFSTKLKEDAV